MTKLRKGRTLLEAIPALGVIDSSETGSFKLAPVGFAHPGFGLEGTLVLGRDSSKSQLLLRSEHVSREHCEFTVHEGSVWIRDLGSRNGTWLRGGRIVPHKSHQLHTGEQVGISRHHLFMLVRDESMATPQDMLMDSMGDDDEPTTQRQARLAAGRPPIPAAGASIPPTPSTELSLEAQITELERQRNVLAVLYQLSLNCLLSQDPAAIEELLTNVLQRMVPLESGFLVHPQDGRWRVSICPSSSRTPSKEMVRGLFDLATSSLEPQVIDKDDVLARLELPPGAAVLAPMVLEQHVMGLVAVYSPKERRYDENTVDIVRQLAQIAVAALRDRS